MGFEIRTLEYSDINEVVNLHIRSFPSFFLSFLGHAFLKEFYTAFINEKTGIGLVSVDSGNQIVGAVVGTIQPSGFFRRLLKRRWWAFCLASTGAILRRPSITPRLFRAAFYRGDAPQDLPLALLSSIAVDPSFQGQGVGRLLVKRFLQELKTRGAAGCFLTTDAEGNDAVNNFYLNNGWRAESTYVTPEGRKMVRYVAD